MSGECDFCGNHTLECSCDNNNNDACCYYCGLVNPKVEASGIWYCPNALCRGPGGAWFRRTLNSYEEDRLTDSHRVDAKEWLQKGRKNNRERGIRKEKFYNTPRSMKDD